MITAHISSDLKWEHMLSIFEIMIRPSTPPVGLKQGERLTPSEVTLLLPPVRILFYLCTCGVSVER